MAKKEYNLEWYVLNEENYQCKEEFKHYPYTFYDTKIKPWNVFNNWSFRDAAIKLAKDYYKGKMKGWEFCDGFPKDGSDYDQFKFRLMRELSYQEHGRCEYEICVAEWPPTYLGKDGKKILVWANQEHEPIEDVKMDKVDCYTQVLPNLEIFAQYILTTVNGTTGTKAGEELEREMVGDDKKWRKIKKYFEGKR